MQNRPNIYDFNQFHTLLDSFFKWLKQANPKASMRWIAKRLDLKSHTYIVRLTRGEKFPSDPLFAKIAKIFNWTVDEFAFARALLGHNSATTHDERDFFLAKIEDLRREVPARLLQLDEFESISKWYHLAIFELSSVKGFSSDPEWIAHRLGHAISAETVDESLRRLCRLGLLREVKGVGYERAVSAFTTSNNIPNGAIRSFHSQMLDRAKESLDSVPMSHRFVFGHTIPIAASKLPDAQQLIIEFRARFHKLMESSEADSVYHLAIQFFPLTVPEIPPPTHSIPVEGSK